MFNFSFNKFCSLSFSSKASSKFFWVWRASEFSSRSWRIRVSRFCLIDSSDSTLHSNSHNALLFLSKSSLRRFSSFSRKFLSPSINFIDDFQLSRSRVKESKSCCNICFFCASLSHFFWMSLSWLSFARMSFTNSVTSFSSIPFSAFMSPIFFNKEVNFVLRSSLFPFSNHSLVNWVSTHANLADISSICLSFSLSIISWRLVCSFISFSNDINSLSLWSNNFCCCPCSSIISCLLVSEATRKISVSLFLSSSLAFMIFCKFCTVTCICSISDCFSANSSSMRKMSFSWRLFSSSLAFSSLIDDSFNIAICLSFSSTTLSKAIFVFSLSLSFSSMTADNSACSFSICCSRSLMLSSLDFFTVSISISLSATLLW